jgi:CIC family chloride channel protein
VLGVGYGATEAALQVSFSLALLIAVGVAKLVATAISLGFGFGGGVFSPSLVIGAMLGGAYGIVVAGLSPELSSGPGAYTIVGMGAMAAAVLGAPISTTLIVFEMTGHYAITMAVMVAAVFASLVTRDFHGGSFFAWQLERRGLDLKSGFESALLRALGVGQVMSRVSELVTRDVGLRDLREMLQQSERGKLFVVRDNGELFGTITLADLSEVAFDPTVDDLIKAGDVARSRPPVLSAADDLEAALKLMRDTGESYIAVVEDKESMLFLGSVDERDVMSAYNRALLERRREELGG